MDLVLDHILFSLLLIMHQDYTAIALLLFTALPLISVAVAVLFYVRNNERKTPLRRKTFVDRSTMYELPSLS